MTSIKEAVVPATQTPIVLIAALIIGLGVAYVAWTEREEIDLFFFRASGGNAKVGRMASVLLPLLIALVSVGFVVSTLF